MNVQALREALAEEHRGYLDDDAPLPARMMAAKGLAPLPSREMVIVLSGLAGDSEPKVREAAADSLATMPDKILAPALAAELPTEALNVLTYALLGRDPMLEAVVLNRRTSDRALAAIAPEVSAAIGEILIANQERCLRSRELVAGLRDNPRIAKSSKDRLFDFLVRSGVLYDEMPEFAEAFSRLAPQAIARMSETVSLPPEVMALSDEGVGEQTDSVDADGADPGSTTRATPILQLINGLNTAQKIALAMKGNKEARAILVRDTNRMVASAVIRSPRITEPEVIAVAQSRQVDDDVIRFIAVSRELTRPYAVKVALANNPKTPQAIAMKLLTLLRQAELRTIAKSKNVPSAVAAHAQRVLHRKAGATR